MASAFLSRHRSAALVISALILPLTGCGVGPLASPAVEPMAAVSGTVFGGIAPIVGANISLMAAGITGYGSAPTVLSSTTTGPNGSFTLPTHTCATPDSLVYIQATGGNPGSFAANSAINLIAIIGNCSAATSSVHVNVNEATTIAAAYALAQFASVTTAHTYIGTSSTNVIGLNNAAGPAATLVNTTTGLANTTNTTAGLVLPTAVVNSLADALAACTNSTGTSSTACTTLFKATTVNGVPPTDTLQVAFNIALHPASNVSTLLGLVTSTSPFQPTITSTTPPTDLTVAIGYNGSGISTYGAIDVSIDAVGNAWISTFNTTPTLTGLIEITPTGQYSAGPTGYGTNVLAPSVGLNIDQQGIIWVNSTNGNALIGFNPNGSVYTNITGVNNPNGQAIDSSGDIWTDAGGNANNTFSEVLKSGTNYTLQPTITAASHFGTGICINPTTLFETAPGAPGEASAVTVVNLSTKAVSSFTPDNGNASISGCSIDHSGNLWLPDNSNFNGVEVWNASGAMLNAYAIKSGVYPQEMAIDGLGNAFISAYISQSIPQTIVELTSTGTLVSPAGGYAPTTGTTNTNGTYVGLTDIITTDPGGVAIDPSGNLWLSGTNGGTTVPTYVTEIVGLAAPVLTPKAVALSNNVIATRP
jgi:hypothetical protein